MLSPVTTGPNCTSTLSTRFSAGLSSQGTDSAGRAVKPLSQVSRQRHCAQGEEERWRGGVLRLEGVLGLLVLVVWVEQASARRYRSAVESDLREAS